MSGGIDVFTCARRRQWIGNAHLYLSEEELEISRHRLHYASRKLVIRRI